MASLTSSLMTSRQVQQSSSSATPQSSRTSMIRPRKSTAPDFGTPIKVESSSPYRTPESSSKALALLARTPFGTPQKVPPPSLPNQAPSSQSGISSAKPAVPLSGRAQLSARIRSLWLGSGPAAATVLQGKSHLPYSGLAKLMLQTNSDRLYLLSFLAIHIFLSSSLFSPLSPISSSLLSLTPSLVLLSTITFACSLLPFILLRRISVAQPLMSSKSNAASLQDVKILNLTLKAGTPAAHYFFVVSQVQTLVWISLHSFSGLLLASFYAAGLLIYSGSTDAWTPYQTISIRNSQGLKVSLLRPNERFFFLLASNLIVGTFYALNRSLSLSNARDASSTPLTEVAFEARATLQSPSIRIASKLRQRLSRALVIGAAVPLVSLVVYMIARRPLFRLVLSIIGHDSALRPILIPSFRKAFLGVGFLLRITTLGAFSTATWETFDALWEVFATQPFNDLQGGLSQYSREPTKCLIEGMQSRRTSSAKEGNMTPAERQYFAHFAFAEMAVVAATDHERRKAIFRDVGAGSSGNGGIVPGSKSAWVLIAQECVKVLQEERISVSSRGRPAPTQASTTASQRGTLQRKADDVSHKVPVESASTVMKSRPASIWDKLASTSGTSASSAASGPSAAATSTSTTGATADRDGLGSILHRLVPPATSTVAAKRPSAVSTNASSSPSDQAQPPTATVVIASILFSSSSNVAQTIYALLPPDLRHVLSRLPIIRSAGPSKQWLLTPTSTTLLYTGRLPQQSALTTWSIQTLSALVSASVDQDDYGTVALSSQLKVGVDDVLDEIASLLLALSQWGQEIAKEMGGKDEGAKQKMTAMWDARVAPIVLAARTAIKLITGVFEPTKYQFRQATRDKIEQAMTVA